MTLENKMVYYRGITFIQETEPETAVNYNTWYKDSTEETKIYFSGTWHIFEEFL